MSIQNTQKDFNSLNRELTERVKELNCLYKVSQLTDEMELELKIFFADLIKIIQKAWQYEDITAVKINYNSETYISDNFKETPFFHSSDIIVNDKKRGKISVYYIEKKPNVFNGPFLKEEVDLLQLVAANIGRYFERKDYLHDRFMMEKYLGITIQSIGDAVIATDLYERVSLMNKVAEGLTGYSFKEAKGEKLEDIFNIEHAITGEKAENPAKKVLETGKIVGLANHTKLISKNGEEFQIADSGSPITDENNEIHGVVLVFRDVTREYQLNEDLATKTLHLEKAQKIGKTGSWKFYLNSGKVVVSNEARKIYGLPNNMDLLITDVQKVPLKKYRSYLDKAMKNLINGSEDYKVEFQIKRLNDDEIIDIYSIAEFDKERNVVEGVIRDITEKKRFEFELLETERQLSSMINNLPGAVYKCKFDRHWTMIYLSDNIRQIVGYNPDSFINNKELSFNDIIHPDFKDIVREKWDVAVENKAQFECEYKLLTLDNKEIWVLERGIAVYENDNVVFLEGYIEDVNEKKISQDEIIELKDNLEEKVNEMTSELQNRVDELERFHEATIEREFRIKELRDELESLKEKLDGS